MPDPSRLRAHLGGELKGVRTLAGKTQRGLAGELGASQSRLVFVEQGVRLLSRNDARAWLTACGASDDLRDRVLALTEAAHSETRAWRDGLSDAGHLQGVAREREQGARRIRTYSPSLIPGLLQTAEYARQMMPQLDPTGEMDYARALASRMERGQILHELGRRFDFLLEELAVRWAPADGVMAAQLDRVQSLDTLDAVSVRVLPSSRVGAPSWNGFVLYEPQDGPSYVTTEFLHGGGVIADPDAVRDYETVWSRLWEAAVHGDEAVDLIRAIG